MSDTHFGVAQESSDFLLSSTEYVQFPPNRLFFPFRRNTTSFAEKLSMMIIAVQRKYIIERINRTLMQHHLKEYLLLFNTITDLEDALSDLRERLITAQQRAEELYLTEAEETPA